MQYNLKDRLKLNVVIGLRKFQFLYQKVFLFAAFCILKSLDELIILLNNNRVLKKYIIYAKKQHIFLLIASK